MKRRTPPDSSDLFSLPRACPPSDAGPAEEGWLAISRDLPPPGGPDFTLERQILSRGFSPVAGTDEAGRGPLAGPVVAAAVILDPAALPQGLDDSKALSPRQRVALYDVILKVALAVSIASSSPRHIDARDIRKASLDAMRRAVAGLSLAPGFVLADGRDRPPGLACAAQPVIEGDARSMSIAAASIVAKVMRDRMMERAGAVYPDYGFGGHAGYGTAQHRGAIALIGPCPLHRMSFKPLKA